MYIKPCRRCPLNEVCEKYKVLTPKLYELSVTSAFVQCQGWKDLYPIGSTVTKALFLLETSDGEKRYLDAECIVVGYKKDRLRLWPMCEEKYNLFATSFPDDVVVNDSKVKYEICPECGKPKQVELTDWFCNICGLELFEQGETGNDVA